MKNPFSVTRAQHVLETAEDYTELVADLIIAEGEARIRDIAKRMEVSHVSALRTVRRLARDGYLNAAPHTPITLTEKGKELAQFSKKRHLLLIDFLRKIGVSPAVAEIDAEGIEHHISKETLRALQKHMENF